MSLEEQKQERQKERQHQIHSQNLQSAQMDEEEGSAAEIIKILSEIDDLPINPKEDPVMGQLISTLTSTANLSPEQVRSNEWVREYILVLYLCKYPKENGLNGSWRGLAHGDPSEAREPMSPDTRMMIETLVSTSKLALTRSEDAKVIEEGARTINESVVNDHGEDKSSGGLLGRLRR